MTPDNSPSPLQRQGSRKKSHEGKTPPRRSPSGRRQLQISIPFSSDPLARELTSDRLLSSVLLGAPVLLFVLDSHFRIVFADGRTAGLLPGSPDQYVDRSLFEVLPDSHELRTQLDQALSGTAVSANLETRGRTLHATFLPLGEQGEGVAGIALVATDVTVDGHGEHPRDTSTRGEDATNGEVTGPAPDPATAQLRHISHELRTPLNSLVGFANLIARAPDAPVSNQTRFYLERILSNSTHLLSVVNGMIDLSLIQSGKSRITLTDENLESLIRETIGDLKGLQPEGTLYLAQMVPEDVIALRTDRQKLKQILINLVANAMKYTHKGSVTVRVAVDEFRRPVRIDVIDTGEGIPEDRLAEIFEAFERGTHRGDELTEGAGLGLTISRSLCELLGYKISIESKVGKGSTFSVWLEPQSPEPGGEITKKEKNTRVG